MSSECSADPHSEENRLEIQRGEEMKKDEAETPDSQPTGRLRQQQSEEKEVLSFNRGGRQEVTSVGELGQVLEEKEQRNSREKKEEFSTMSVNQESQDGALVNVSGVWLADCCLQSSFPRGVPARSYPDRDRERQAAEPRGPGPFYFVGGANGAEIVSRYCESRGWKRIYNKHREDFKLKWCENKSHTNYYNFREGVQLVYQIPNNKHLTTKIGLLSSLREYERVWSKVNQGEGLRRLKMEEFIPATFRMDVREEREAFFTQRNGKRRSERRMWISKPSGLNQGRGIFLLKSQEDMDAFRLKLQDVDRQASRRPQARIVQQYIQNPLLLKGKKFDVRSYLLIACTAPYMVFFRHGYVRLTCDLYDPNSNNLTAHLTNQYMQKKNPLYSQLKEDTVWSMESFNAYVNDKFQVAKALPGDWVMGAFAKRMQEIMTQCFFAVKSKLDCRLGFFDLIGCDFMIDEDFKVWLLEMNCNPALHTNCEVLKEVIPKTVVETLDMTLEIFSKHRLRQRILPLASQKEFVLLYNGALPPAWLLPCSRSNAASDSQFCQKTTKKTETRSKSGKKINTVSPISPDNSVDDLATYGKLGVTKTRHRPTASSASLVHQCSLKDKDSSAQKTSHSNRLRNSTAAVRRNAQPRVELRMSKCTLYHQWSADDLKDQRKRNAVSLSTNTASIPNDKSDPKTPKPAEDHPRVGCPTGADSQESGEGPGEKEPKA
ncbi:hypothetical protein LDENG_00058110 [Lucifuga dentata]|nr:hypothetical protein LDENG_00058110 [Lucifuga dentata]